MLGGECLDLRRGAVGENDPDVQRTKDRDIQKDIGKVLVRHDRPVDADDKRLEAKSRNVAQDAA